MPLTVPPSVKIGDLPWTLTSAAPAVSLEVVQAGLPRLPRDGREYLHWLLYLDGGLPQVYRLLAQGPDAAPYTGALVVPVGKWPTRLRVPTGDELLVRAGDLLECG